ncbi:copper amine oxidase N-terminal domain-containing protein [Cohnella silvisoli]|uniref:Copper amine oxidase N-terminal domain-containing protein n=1 Tax=Cohnella silvisoli TaxID=2873699 RepID=A0ABV1KRY4_9BACL|nr:copper amine oxidase N-terminal domain-containing protein [Cohnella silvisoli]MCD9022567.1 copper amine oxidase N-terminal domain-containing protein [Cohnella silvisoli]
MKKLISTLVAFVVIFSVIVQPEAQAASAIKIIIDGEVLKTDQAPVAIDGRTMVPLRGIFEALNAIVLWNQKTQTVTAKKKDTTIVLKLGSKTATINNQTVTLDAPARAIHGRTMVPVRFVSESLGDEVVWNSKSRSVIITTSTVEEVGAASSVNAALISQYGDGRDMQVGFTPPSDQSNVDSYRILVVKAENASSFNLAKAQIVGPSNYTLVPSYYANQKTTLSAQARDVDGDLIHTKQAYKVFVLTVGNDIYAISNSSASVTLTGSPSVDAATNVKITDVSDYGDGRDLSVSFTKASNDSYITGYRVMIVKSTDAAKFGLTTANGVSSSYYTTVSKSNSSTLSFTYNSSSRDISGELIKNGVAYTAFVLSLSNNTGVSLNGLSAPSVSVTLGTSALSPIITNVADVNDNGDGRDLQVSFYKAADESRISFYRIFVVRAADYGSFNVTEANKVSSGRYYDVSKTGNSFSQILSSSSRDVKGSYITNGVAYRVFVMGVSNNSSYPNVLSAASSSITLSNTRVSAVTNLYVSDVSDNGNGQDLRVAFTKAADESSINHYRIFVVRDVNASGFNLASANAITDGNYYTTAYKTGGNISQVLSSSARDVNGAYIQNGVSYRIFVLSVGGGNSAGTNALSQASSAITLTASNVSAVTNVYISDVGDNNNGADLRVAFTKAADESNISNYRIFVVKETNASGFNLASANATSYYSTFVKTGGNISQELPSGARDVNGAYIQNGVSYRVFVLSVGGGNSAGTNALSLASSAITLSISTVTAATNLSVSDVGEFNNGQDLRVTFTKPANESNIDYYRIFAVKNSNAGAFNLAAANAITNNNYYTTFSKTGGNTLTLSSDARDVNGEFIKNGVSYRVFVLSVGGGTSLGVNALSLASPAITLSNSSVSVATNLIASDVGDSNNGQDLRVTFAKAADESNISQYRIFVVKDVNASAFDPNKAIAIANPGLYTAVPITGAGNHALSSTATDVDGAAIKNGVNYRVFVLSVANGGMSSSLSAPSNLIVLAPTPVVPAPKVQSVTAQQNGTNNELAVSFTLPASENGIAHYAVLLVPDTGGSLSENAALGYYNATTKYYTKVEKSIGSVTLTSLSKDVNGAMLAYDILYKIYVLSIADGTNATASKLSDSSASVKLIAPPPPS